MGTYQPRPPSVTAPVGLVYLASARLPEEGVTIRWRRYEDVASVLAGQAFDEPGAARVVDRIAVPPSGWTDLAEVRRYAKSWLRERLSAGAR